MEKVLHSLEHDTDAPGRQLLHIAFAPTMRAPRFSEGAPRWTPGATRSLDPSQRSAVALALAAGDVALIHGPPGELSILLQFDLLCLKHSDRFYHRRGAHMSVGGQGRTRVSQTDSTETPGSPGLC